MILFRYFDWNETEFLGSSLGRLQRLERRLVAQEPLIDSMFKLGGEGSVRTEGHLENLLFKAHNSAFYFVVRLVWCPSFGQYRL